MIPYSDSKAGVICLTKALAKYVITEGIRVNAVAPSVIETPLLSQLQPEAVEYMRSKAPMGRLQHTVIRFIRSLDCPHRPQVLPRNERPDCKHQLSQ